MAYYSSYKKRRYTKRGYYGPNWKRTRLTTTRAFKRSASNMTQNGLFNVNCVVPVVLTPVTLMSGGSSSGYTGAFKVLDVPGTVFSSAMHAALKKVFDQYRIEKVSVKIAMGSNSDAIPVGTMFACLDRTGFDDAGQLDLAQVRSYGSYKEKQTSSDGTAGTPLVMNIAQTDIIGLSLYRDTYSTVTFPKVLVGWHAYTSATLKAVQLQIEIDAAVRYRGVRLSNKSGVPSIGWSYLQRGTVSDLSEPVYWNEFQYTAVNKSVSLSPGDLIVSFVKQPRFMFNASWCNYTFFHVNQATSASVAADSYYVVISAEGASLPDVLLFCDDNDNVLTKIEEHANGVPQYLYLGLYPEELMKPEEDPYAEQLGI